MTAPTAERLGPAVGSATSASGLRQRSRRVSHAATARVQSTPRASRPVSRVSKICMNGSVISHFDSCPRGGVYYGQQQRIACPSDPGRQRKEPVLSQILNEILAHKRCELEQSKAARPLEELKSWPAYFMPRRNFYGAVSVPRQTGPNVIAEIKRSSPSAGLICADFDPATIARRYESGGAQALSVLTDERYFGGRLEFIEEVKAAVGLPVLRKDFVVEAYQLHESRAYGADAVLLIADALGAELAIDLVKRARALNLWVLLEVHARDTLLDVLGQFEEEDREGVLLGINNRNLQTQTIDLSTTEELAGLVPPGFPVVAESGIKKRRDAERMHIAGARALLVGEMLMRDDDPARAIAEIRG